MCGIGGQFCYGDETPNRVLLNEMSNKLIHRGPDGEGKYINNKIGLIHRRLAIIDLTEDGTQPMSNEDDTLWIVFNGEIYNYIELREELKKYGHVFKSQSDTEVIIHAYEQWGRGCLNKFNGMWAFALWDENTHQLFCARDRFGIKPFYYALYKDSFIFASEIKSLLVYPGVGTSPNDYMVKLFLTCGVKDHCEETMFHGIYQLLPSECMMIRQNGFEDKFKYWDISVNPKISGELKENRFLDILQNAINIHSRSDVQVGTCLSGGLDSSILVALGKQQKTFSAIFSDSNYDESKYIKDLTDVVNVDSYTTEPNANNLMTDIKNLVYIQDEPFGSLSIYAQYCVMCSAQGKVKVLLDGQGADELLAGYIGYQASYIRGLIKQGKWVTAIKEIAGSIYNHYGFWLDAMRQNSIRNVRNNKFFYGCAFSIDRYGGSLDKILYKELMSTNLQQLLHYEDRNSMAFSIESRVPYLDVNFVECVSGLPLNKKIKDVMSKWIMRESACGIIPESIRQRKDKMGFVTPEELWMKNELKEFVIDILSSDSFTRRDYWNVGEVVKSYNRFVKGEEIYSPELWRVISTELWLREFFDGRKL
jgi:asparagine synthase (glutamine-hydrolysing)